MDALRSKFGYSMSASCLSSLIMFSIILDSLIGSSSSSSESIYSLHFNNALSKPKSAMTSQKVFSLYINKFIFNKINLSATSFKAFSIFSITSAHMDIRAYSRNPSRTKTAPMWNLVNPTFFSIFIVPGNKWSTSSLTKFMWRLTSCKHWRAFTLQCVGDMLLSSICLFNLFRTRTKLLIIPENFQYACSAFSVLSASKNSINRFKNEFLHNSKSFFDVTVVSKSLNNAFNSGSSLSGFVKYAAPPLDRLVVELFMVMYVSIVETITTNDLL